MNIPPPIFDNDPPPAFDVDEVYHAQQGDIQKDSWGIVEKSEDINANTRDLEAERKAYEQTRDLREGYEHDEKFHMGHVEESQSLEEGWVQQNLKQIIDLRAKNADIQLRSAEKARKSRATGLVNCSPESVVIKHDHGNSSDFPDIGPDPLNTTDYRGSERNQLLEYADMSRSYAQSAPQYYYTKEPIQEKASSPRVKHEPPSDPI